MFSKADRQKVWFGLSQVLIGYVAVGIVAAFVTAALVLFIHIKETIPYSGLLISCLLFGVVAGFAAILYMASRAYVADLLYGKKEVYIGFITGKATETSWGWHGNPAADAVAQPRLISYRLLVDGQEVGVSEETYNSLVTGDAVRITVAPRSKLVLEVMPEL
ncbi:MAG: hypothetical protein LPK03_06575 [Pontibacter sp.]|nr:hypothetical protein [Pontibacter sp.]